MGLVTGFMAGVGLDAIAKRTDATRDPNPKQDSLIDSVLKEKNAAEKKSINKGLIETGRNMVIEILSQGVNNDIDFRDKIEHSSIYYQLKGYLSAGYIAQVDSYKGGWSVIMPAGGANMPPLASGLLVELDRLEKDWGLLQLFSHGPAP